MRKIAEDEELPEYTNVEKFMSTIDADYADSWINWRNSLGQQGFSKCLRTRPQLLAKDT
jgi:hypothetical protein